MKNVSINPFLLFNFQKNLMIVVLMLVRYVCVSSLNVDTFNNYNYSSDKIENYHYINVEGQYNM
jgi:hypothetical protein